MKQFCRDQLFELNKKHGRKWNPLKIQVQQNSWFRGKCNGTKNFDAAAVERLMSHPVLRPVYRTGAFPMLTGCRGGRGWEGEIMFRREVVATVVNGRWKFTKPVSVLEKANYWAYPRSDCMPWRSYGPNRY